MKKQLNLVVGLGRVLHDPLPHGVGPVRQPTTYNFEPVLRIRIQLDQLYFGLLDSNTDPLHESDPDTDPGNKNIRQNHGELNQPKSQAYHI